MQPRNNFPLIAGIIVIAIVLAAGGYWFLHRTPHPPAPPPAPVIDTFTETYTTGFEGENYDVSYSLSYPADTFTVKNDGDNKTAILLDNVKTGAESSIK